jgi:chain length determinant protein EpsF
MGFFQFLTIIRARFWIAVGVFAACVVVSQIVTLRSPELYTALASVVVNSKSDPVTAAGYPGQGLTNVMDTQTDIVTSQRVAERVVRSLGFDRDPALKQAWLKTTKGRGDYVGWLAAALHGCITVPAPRESNVINISATWTDAKGAAKIANAFAQAYIETNIELRVLPAKQYAAWFDERSRALRADLEAKQKQLTDYQDKVGMLATDEHLDVEMTRLAELSSQLVAIQTQRQESQSREAQVGGNADAVLEILQNPLITSLKAELSQAEAKRQDLATLLDTNHPDYQRAEATIASLEARIAHETGKVIDSLRNATQINLRRERAIDAAMDVQKKRVEELKHQRTYAAILQSDIATAQRNFDAVSQGLAQTSLESQARQANAAQLTRATEPAVPSSPKRLRNLALGILCGLALGVAVALWFEKLDQRVRTDIDLQQLLGVPLLAGFSVPRSERGTTPRLSYFVSIASKALGFRAAAKALTHQPG